MPQSLVLLALALALVACRDADAPAPEPATGPPGETVVPEEPAARSGSGTLTLDGTTYPFDVLACDLSGETDDDYQTISGRGTTPEGERFDVFVSRDDSGGFLIHTVSFQTGEVIRGEGTVLEAQRMRMNGSWSSMRGGEAQPLVVIDGNRVTAEGRFSSDEALEATVTGRLEATCEQAW